MSAQVDVLAVIALAADALKYAGAKHDGVQQVLEARAAVAALIAERDALREEVERLLSIIDNAGKVEVHPDDAAVDRFAVAMKAKLADARAKGRGGWQGDEPGMQQRLSDMLRTHVEKGDPRDVANFAMFLHQRYESILPAHQPALVLDDELPGMWSQSDFMGGAADAADDARQLVPSVDDAMVDRYLAAQAKAVQEIDDAWGNGGKAASYLHPVREACRAGLTAALTAARAQGGQS